MPRFGNAILPMLLSICMAGTAIGQTAADLCDVNQQTPSDVGRAFLSLQSASTASAVDLAQNQIRQGVRLLTTAQPGSQNQTGRTMIVGQLYAMWLNLDGSSRKVVRSAVGLQTNINDTIDLVTSVDSIFKIIEKSNPNCVAFLNGYRHVAWWRNTLNEAIRLMSVDSIDAAVVKARETMILASDMPYAFLILANHGVRHEQPDTAVKYYKEAAAESRRLWTAAAGVGPDTAYKSNLASALYEAANVELAAAEDPKHSPTPAKKQERLASAKALLDEMTQLDDRSAGYARSGLVRIAIMSGDSAAIKAMFADQIANPDKYSASQIIQSGVSASEAKLTPIAIQLFDIALAKNPYHRDVLYNFALLYLDPKNNPNWEKGLGLVHRLLKLDPNGHENYRLALIGFSGLRNEKVAAYNAMVERSNKLIKPTDAVARKAVDDSLKVLAPIPVALIDSVVWALSRVDSLPVRVKFEEYSPSPTRVIVGGTIINATDAAKTLTMKIEFLDKAGAVVDTKEQPVTVEAKKSAPFSLTTTSPASGTIVGFRYTEMK